MQLTRTAQKTDTTEAARFVANRVLGDLLSIHEKFLMSTEREMRNLAHDIEVGLANDCLEALSLFLYPKGCQDPHTAYLYRRVAPGSFSSSAHSGRIVRCSMLVGGGLQFEVSLRNRATWDQLKPNLKISWRPCVGRSTAGMSANADGGYASGELGFARTHLRRAGY